MSDRERQVLAELCRPMMTESRTGMPLEVGEIASNLGGSDARINQLLDPLYAKFEIIDDGSPKSRRLRLAKAAIERGWGDGSGARAPLHATPKGGSDGAQDDRDSAA